MRYWVMLIGLALLGCHSYRQEDVEGLWALEEVELDAVQKPAEQLFVELHDNRSFAVSRASGDLAGVYRVDGDQLVFFSDDKRWFRGDWSIYRFNDRLQLEGKDHLGRHLKLTFSHIDEIPDFSEFESRLVGRWQLYKVRAGGNVQRLTDTWFEIDADGNYLIEGREGEQESGKAIINTRHRKISFVNEQKQWNAWFYGKELRLTDQQAGVQYSLRR